ncbi:MAG: hypothetical protein NZ898_00860 [Myxococcota bacterium]|nr:hypothetical protein [Myxococcota bacterium]MDW8364004.1 hypothetical protein [Myxococcales bacterium]
MRALRSTPLLLGLGLLGCASATAGVDASAEGPAGRFALLRVDLDEARAMTVRGAFARHVGLGERDVLDLLGLHAVPIGQCEVDAEARPLDAEGEVELLDAGPLELFVGDRSLVLHSRAFPDIADVVGGAFYAGSWAMPHLDRGERVRIRGEAEIGAFDASLVAPLAPAPAVRHVPARRAGARDLAIGWEPVDPAARIELAIVHAGRTWLACTARDEGLLVIAAADVAVLPAGEARFVLRRVVEIPLTVEGFGRASFVVSSSQSVSAPLP